MMAYFNFEWFLCSDCEVKKKLWDELCEKLFKEPNNLKEQVSENGVERILILPLIFVAKGPRSYKDNTALTYHNDHITNCIPQIKKIYFKKNIEKPNQL